MIAPQRGSTPILGRTIHGRPLCTERGEGEGERRDEGRHQERVHRGEQEVMTMATGKERPPLGRPDPLDNHEATQDHQCQRTNQHHSEQRHRPGEVLAAPMFGPPQADQDQGQNGNGEGGKIETRPQATPRSALASAASTCCSVSVGRLGAWSKVDMTIVLAIPYLERCSAASGAGVTGTGVGAGTRSRRLLRHDRGPLSHVSVTSPFAWPVVVSPTK